MVVMIVLLFGGHVPNIFLFPRRLTYLINLDLTTYDEQELMSFPIHMAACYTVLPEQEPKVKNKRVILKSF